MGKEKIGFIGTGVMGSSIVSHLLKEGYEVTIYTRTKEKASHLMDKGAVWAETVSEVAVSSDVIFTMVGYPIDVENIYFGDDGILSVARKGQIVVDLTTSSPEIAKKISKAAYENQMGAVDAPVSGGDIGARNGTLSIMCGGDKDDFEKVKPLLMVFGKNIIHQGAAGAGQHTKMCNQIAIATNMIGVCEAISYGEKAGLDLEIMLSSITSGAAGSWSLSNLAPRILNEDFEPGFYVKHFMKDMKIALEEAKNMNLNLPGLKLAIEMYETLVERGFAEKGTQVLYEFYTD